MEKSQAGIAVDSSTLRNAAFPQALRGYDREAVHEFLNRIADWLEESGPADAAAREALTSEVAKVGERTSGILTAAEEAAVKLRTEAGEYGDRVRAEAEEDARTTRLTASQKSDELIAEAESKAEAIIDEAIARRRQLNQAVTSLIERRDQIAGEVQELADGLLQALDSIRAGHEVEQADDGEVEEPADSAQAEAERARLIRAGFQPGGAPPEEPTPLEPDDERETRIQETG